MNSPMNSPVRLGVSPAAATPTGFYSQRFGGFSLQCWYPGLRSLSHCPVVLPVLSACECGAASTAWPAWSASHHLTTCLLLPGCPSPPLLPVWMNVSSLIPWLSNSHRAWFSGSSGCFLLLNLLLSFFWLCEEANFIYLCLHLGPKSPKIIFLG